MKSHANVLFAVAAVLALQILGVPIASAAAPTVSIDPSPTPSYTTAEVTGAVNPQQSATAIPYYFEYRPAGSEGWPSFISAGEISAEDAQGSIAIPVSGQLTGLTPGSDYEVRLTVVFEGSELSSPEPNSSFTTLAVGPPAISIGPVTTFTATTAAFTGTINPEAPADDPAFDVDWHFQCSPECPGLQGGTVLAAEGETEVEAETSGLEPNTEYEVTLVAANAGDPLSADPNSFITDAVGPLVQTLGANPTETTAGLGARINPRNSETTYYFEYTTDESFDGTSDPITSLPASKNAAAGSGGAFINVAQEAKGLKPATRYFYRVLAENTGGTATGPVLSVTTTVTAEEPVADTCPNAAIRAQQGAGYLPDCRAYEKVSPPNLGADVELAGWSARAADIGGAVAYSTFGSPTGAPARGSLNQIYSARGAAGWTSKGVTTPLDPYANFGNAHNLVAISTDASVGLASGWGAVDSGHPQMTNLWRWDADGPFALISQPSIPVVSETPDVDFLRNGFGAGSEDLGVVVFGSHRALIPEAPQALDGESDAYLYRWFEGRLDLVAIMTDGTVAPHPALGYGPPTLFKYPGEYAVSADGSRVFFSDRAFPADPERELYLRDDDPRDDQPGVSLHVSESERTDCAGDPTCGGDDIPTPAPDPMPTSAQFQLANADGSQAFFASPRKLTDDATASTQLGFGSLGGNDGCVVFRCDLYRWDLNAPDGQRLTDITTGDPSGAGVLATIGASRDASRVYFVASGNLAPGASQGEPNIFLWRQGEGVRFIATLDGSPGPVQVGLATDIGVWSHVLEGGGPNDGSFRDARVSPDGRYLAFRSRAQLTAYDTDGHYQLYRFDALTDSLECISCNLRTDSSTGDAYLKRHRATDRRPSWLSRNITPEGDVFFDSAEPLVPRDANGKIDVYQWSDGDIQLISSGLDSDNAGFLDASADGRDVFFTTRASLVGSDRDSLVDLYDARIGGGLAESQSPPSCDGDSCQGIVAPPPTSPTAGSAAFNGPRSLSRKPRRQRCAKSKVKRRGKCVKRKRADARGRASR